MSTPIGGLRIRLIHDNIFNVVRSGLSELNWLGASPNHANVVVRQSQIGKSEDVKPNIVCVTIEDDTEIEAEMGSMLTDHHWNCYVDVYAENDTLGLHLATDVKDILNGRFSATVSRGGPNFEVYDLTATHATPVSLFTVELQDIQQNRSRFSEKTYQEHWRVVSFTLLDTYDTEEDS